MTIPHNLISLHSGEEVLRTKSLQLISECADMSRHMSMIEQTMDLIHHLIHPAEADDKVGMCIRMLAIRVFNSLAATLKLLLAGYYQASALQLRDVLETAFLLDYFTSDPTLVEEWLSLPERDRRKKFAPSAVRRALDDRDSLRGKKRSEAYDMFCRLAAHPTPDGATMLMPAQGSRDMHYGPFLEPDGMKAVLSETALCAVQAGIALRRLLKTRMLDQFRSAVSFHENYCHWLHHFFNVEPNRQSLAELRQLLTEAEQLEEGQPSR